MAKFEAEVSVIINAPVAKIWDYLTKPELIQKYFFGTKVEADWKVGGTIYFRGEWEGKKYEDKGKIIELEKNKRMAFLYWSSFSGKADAPENYQKVTYDLLTQKNQTTVTVHQECDDKEHCENNWRMVLDGLKKNCE